jgi:hypothetical protein
MTIDIEALRKDLINYFGTAMQFNPMAIMDLTKVENASPEELVEIAQDNNFDLNDYKINTL